MWKKDVLKYLAVDDNIRNNATKRLTEILGCSNALVSVWPKDELIPAYRAMELDLFFRKKNNRKKYSLSDQHPVFNWHDYVDSKGQVKPFRAAGNTPKIVRVHDEAVRNAAIRVLARADETKSIGKKLKTLTRFVKGLSR